MSPLANMLEATVGAARIETPLAPIVGAVLLHFLWQGFALGALIAATLGALRHRTAAARYAVCVAGMAALLAAPLVTAVLLLDGAAEPWPAVLRPLVAPLAPGTGAAALAPPLAALLPRLPLLWAAGVFTMQLRLIVGWLRANRLRRLDTRPAPARWQRELDSLRACLAVRQPVRLLASSRVIVPAVVGWLRPVVLLPASLMTGLDPDAIRGLLAHELAHVRRHDYLVNVAQCMFESLLFFHPVTWWLSGRLRTEREFCCDDVALTVGGGALAYARTLSSLEEFRDRTPLPALSANGGSLMSRIKRMVGPGAPVEGRASVVAGLLAVVGGITFGALMATGCFLGDPVAPVEASAADVGPSAAPVGMELSPASEEVTAQVFANLEAAVAQGKLSPEALATLRAKFESGEARLLGASCDPGQRCGSGPGCGAAAGCTPGAGCEPGAACEGIPQCGTAGVSAAALVELSGNGDGTPQCVVLDCEDDATCEAILHSAGIDSAAACRTILDSTGAPSSCCPLGPEAKPAAVELVEITEDGC